MNILPRSHSNFALIFPDMAGVRLGRFFAGMLAFVLWTAAARAQSSAAAPTFSPGGGTYTSGQTVAITTSTGGASIRYTTDGSTPTETNGTLYSGPLNINVTTTLQAIAYETGYTDSPVASATYTINPPISLSGVRLWLKADDPAITLNNGNVKIWPDRSSNGGNDATQLTGANQPALVANAVNGRPVVRFNGTSSWMSLPNFMNGDTTGGELFVVVKAAQAVPSNASCAWQFGGANSGEYYTNTVGAIYDDFGSTTRTNEGVPSIPVNQYNVYNVSADNSSWTARMNGQLLFTRSSNQVGFNTAPTIGLPSVPFYFNGDIAEIIVYDHKLSDADRAAVGAYCTAKYALPIPPPSVPTGLTAVVVSPTQVNLSWTQAATTGITYTIERSQNGGSYSVIGQVTDGSSYFDSGLVANTTYSYQIEASDYAGSSGYGTQQSVTTPGTGTDFPTSGMRLWLKADDGPVITAKGVSIWQDRTPGADGSNNATQLTGANQPALVTAATDSTVPNGRPVVRFNGTSSYLTLPNFMNGDTTSGELFVVVKAAQAVPTNPRCAWQFGGSGSPSYYPHSNGSVYDDFGSTTRTDIGVPSIPVNQYNLYNVSADNTSWTARMNGVLLSQSASNQVAFNSAPTLGYWTNGTSTYYFNGDIAEVVVYGRMLSDAERASVQTYLYDKYFQPAAAPTFNPASGTYFNAQIVTITSATNGATIRYTTDGSPPTETNGTVYSGPVSITATTTLQAIAYEAGYADSPVASGTYTLQAATPVFNLAPGTYFNAQTVAITTATSGATIRYTTDGSTPTETNGTLYAGPVTIDATTVLNAIANEAGFNDSSVASGTYTLAASLPVFNPAPGTYANAQTVTITSATTGAAIRYTTDGSMPTETNGTLYSGRVSIGATTTLQAVAYEAGFADSAVASGTYTLQAAAPVFSPASGHTVTIASATSGATIRYTTDGSTPTEINGAVYSAPLSITAPVTLKAVAYETGFTDSMVTSATIGITTVTIATPANGSTINN